MIKIFRRIRQNLLSEGKTRPNDTVGRPVKPAWPLGKYLLYAIGEIVLVMIGILLALQVNEWNKEQNRKKDEAIIVAQLKSDLKQSVEGLEEIKEFSERRARASAIVCHAFWKKETPHDSIYQYMRIPRGNRIYSPTLGTLQSLISSGNITLLKSDSLKNDITVYLEEVDYKLKDISRYEETYYREGAGILNEIVAYHALYPKAYFDDLIEKSNDPSFEPAFKRRYSERPNVIEKVPFETNLQELFNDRKVFTAYTSLLIAHRNSANKYNEMLKITNELLDKLEHISTHSE